MGAVAVFILFDLELELAKDPGGCSRTLPPY